MGVFGLGFWEIGVLVAVGVVLLGPKHLPGVVKTISQGIRELRGASQSLRTSLDPTAPPPRRPRVPEPADQPIEDAEFELVEPSPRGPRPAAPSSKDSARDPPR